MREHRIWPIHVTYNMHFRDPCKYTNVNVIYCYYPPPLFSLAKKTMFRMAFHGKYGNVWNALMSVPEVSYISESELLQ